MKIHICSPVECAHFIAQSFCAWSIWTTNFTWMEYYHRLCVVACKFRAGLFASGKLEEEEEKIDTHTLHIHVHTLCSNWAVILWYVQIFLRTDWQRFRGRNSSSDHFYSISIVLHHISSTEIYLKQMMKTTTTKNEREGEREREKVREEKNNIVTFIKETSISLWIYCVAQCCSFGFCQIPIYQTEEHKHTHTHTHCLTLALSLDSSSTEMTTQIRKSV